MNNVESLLRRYQEGSLTPEELSELNQLTHRDKVFAAACQQAKAIHRRRYAAVSGVAAVLIVVGVIFFARPSVDNALSEMPMVAQTNVPKPTEMEPNVPASSATPKATEVVSTPAPKVRHNDTAVLQSEPKLVSPVTIEQPASVEAVVESQEPSVVVEDPIVACNTQCSPDSVINDIWKFLRT